MSKINSIICIDCETGGFSPIKNPITQIAYEAFQLDDYEMLGEYSTYVKNYNNLEVTEGALEVTGLTIEKIEKEGINIKDVVKRMCDDFQSFNTAKTYTKKPILVGHNVGFDVGFIVYAFNYCKVDISKYLTCNEDAFGNKIPTYIDTLGLAKCKWGNSKEDLKYKLKLCIQRAGLQMFDAHSALDDVRATTGLFLSFIEAMRDGNNKSNNSESVVRENLVRKHFQF